MSLAFALVAAINGSTGSRATLSYGLYWDQASSASARRREDSHGSGVAAQAARVAGLKTAAASSHLFLHPSVLDDDERFAALRDALERVRALGVQCAPSRDLVAALG